MSGQADGTFSLEMQGMSGNDVVSSAIIANVPTTPNTLASLIISGGVNTASALTVDVSGDGKNIITLTPKVGEIVNYEPPAPAPAPQIISSGGGGVSFSTPVIILEIVVAIASTSSWQATSTATTTQQVATSTIVIATSTKPVQTKKKTPVPVALPKKLETNIPQTPLEIRFLTGQTASVYSASQQSVLKKVGEMVYNGLHELWLALKRFF